MGDDVLTLDDNLQAFLADTILESKLKDFSYSISEVSDESDKTKKIIKFYSGATSFLYTLDYDTLNPVLKAIIEKKDYLTKKSNSKNDAKSLVNKRYKIGDHLMLKGKIRDGSEKIVKKFVVKKVIWSIKNKPMNILILKQYEGPCNNMTLNKSDCVKYHIKYEPGLQAYSMMMNFYKIKPKQIEITKKDSIL